VYQDALGNGVDVVQRPDLEGVEDYVRFASRPVKEALWYEVDVSAVAGLRMVPETNVLEFMTEEGNPQLRIAPPYGVDARGERVEATLRVEGCAVDERAAAPWGRGVVPPGKKMCRVGVAWQRDAENYPVVIDPSWETTGSLSVGRYFHTSFPDAISGVMVVGGMSNGFITKSCEGYKNGSWATLANLNVARFFHGGVGGMVVGGWDPSNGFINTSETYHNGTGQWSVQQMPVGLQFASGDYTSENRSIFIGDPSKSGYLFDHSKKTWAETGSMQSGRRLALIFTGELTNPKLNIAIGGTNSENKFLETTEIFDIAQQSWTPGPSLSVARSSYAGFRSSHQGSYFVLVSGGLVANDVRTNSAEKFDWVTQKWSQAGNMNFARSAHNMVRSDGFVMGGILVAGGNGVNGALKSAEVYSLSQNKWLLAGNLSEAKSNASMTLRDGVVVVAGGTSLGPGNVSLSLKSCDIFQPLGVGQSCFDSGECAEEKCACGVCVKSLLKQGSVCGCDSACESGSCVDGVCCDSACTGDCQACSAAAKGKGVDGVCENVSDGLDPHNDCDPKGAGVCQLPGVCNGAGACKTKESSECAPASCETDASQRSAALCTANGDCGNSAVTSCPGNLKCKGAKCLTKCSSSDDCVAPSLCDTATGGCSGPADKLKNGDPCEANNDCSSGFCVAKVCCNQACEGACQACGGENNKQGPGGVVGVCGVAAEGSNPGNQCKAAATECGAPGVCDKNGACATNAPSSKTCGKGGLCASDTIFVGEHCDGKGTCIKDSMQQPCKEGYLCSKDLGACLQICGSDKDCTSDYKCSSNQCILKTAVQCAGPFAVKGNDGSEESCKGYQCLDGSGCRDTCAKPNECDAASGFSCQSGKCLLGQGAGGSAGSAGSSAAAGSTAAGGSGGGSPGGAASVPTAEAPAGDDGGCGCAVPGPSQHSRWALLGLALAATTLRRRRAA
jgi:hypothetical protein